MIWFQKLKIEEKLCFMMHLYPVPVNTLNVSHGLPIKSYLKLQNLRRNAAEQKISFPEKKTIEN